MKQADIKKGRSYCGVNNIQIRHVVDSGVDDFDVAYVVWTTPGLDHEQDQPLKSFARWAYMEVRPVYDGVTRCPNCDAWEWISHCNDTRAECPKGCGTVWNWSTGKVVKK